MKYSILNSIARRSNMGRFTRTMVKAVTVLSLLGLLALPAVAADFDFSGNFRYDNDVVKINFTVGAASTVTVFSSSWLSGDPPQGFDPMLGIWTAAGALIYFQDDGHTIGSTSSNSVSYNHGNWDSYYTVNLSPGTYIATVTQYDNFNNTSNLSGGFRYDSVPNFTATYGGGTQPMFNGVYDTNDPRTNYWQFHLLNVDRSIVAPLPGSLVLLGSGLITLIGLGRRKS
jgi:hypothetical protein